MRASSLRTREGIRLLQRFPVFDRSNGRDDFTDDFRFVRHIAVDAFVFGFYRYKFHNWLSVVRDKYRRTRGLYLLDQGEAVDLELLGWDLFHGFSLATTIMT
jgi:hypothetical protein